MRCLAADDPGRAAHRHRARHSTLDRAARGNIAGNGRREKGIRVVVRTKLKQVAGTNGLVDAHDNGTASALLVLARIAVEVAPSVPALELAARAREDLANELAAVVRALVAHHLVISGTAQVGIGEIAVESALETTRDMGGDGRAAKLGRRGCSRQHRIDLLAIGPDNAPDVIRRLHATLDL